MEAMLLEHIREETCESFDSGHADSSHTMQSNFNHALQFRTQTNADNNNKLRKSFNKTYQIMIPADDEDGIEP